MKWSIALGICALALSACGGGDDEPRPAATVRSETRQAQPEAPIGTAFELGALTVTVYGVEFPDSPDGRTLDTGEARFVLAEFRIENRGETDRTIPDTNVTCDGGNDGGWYVYDGADAIDAGAGEIPPASFIEGKRLMTQPSDCENPSLTVSATGAFLDGSQPKPVRIPLPSE